MSEEKQPYNLMMIRNGLSPKTTGAKPKKAIRKISEKLKAEREKEKVERNGENTELQKWYELIREISLDGMALLPMFLTKLTSLRWQRILKII